MICCFRAYGIVTPVQPAAAAGALSAFLPSRAVVLVVSAVLAYGDCRDVSVAGAEGPGVRVVGEDDARSPQLVDQARCLTGCDDLHGAARWRLIAVEEDGQGGQVRQDL